MDDHEQNVAGGEETQPAITVVTADGEHDFPSVSKAARALAKARYGKKLDAADQPACPTADLSSEARRAEESAATAEPAAEPAAGSDQEATAAAPPDAE